MCVWFMCFIIFLYVCFDVNYFIRTYFTVLTGRLFQKTCFLNDVTTIYGIHLPLQNSDVWFRDIRVARLIREIDFARYHFYDRTGIYQRSQDLKIRSLQGCTLTVYRDSIPLFSAYKINTKLVYWDDRSLFFEHEIITLRDNKVRYLIISRQHAIGVNGDSSDALLFGLPGSENKGKCPEHIKKWLKSMELTSHKIRNRNKLNKLTT